mgnify:CR=1 FL=1
MSTYLITGSNRGIGLELCKQIIERGDEVIATCREASSDLKNLGVTIVNTESDNTVCVDRKLITGASPSASNELGKLAAKTLLKVLN